jgi:hypothetical protein
VLHHIGHGLRLYATRDKNKYDLFAGVRDFSDSFRADDGFVPQVGIRSFYGEAGYHLYPKSGVSFIRPYLGVERIVAETGGNVVHDGIYPGIYYEGGPFGSRGWITLHPIDRDRVGSAPLRYKFVEFDLRGVPSRWLTSLVLHGTAGGKLDYSGAREGHGASLQLTGDVRPGDHLDLQLTANREWLHVSNGERVFAAQIERVKATYTLSSRSLVRAIAQYDAVDQSIRTGGFTTSLLYGYRVNWQTVFYAGYGDDRLLEQQFDGRARLRRNGSTFFAKVSYAWQH